MRLLGSSRLGKKLPAAAWGSSAPRRRPGWPADGAGARCARSGGPLCARSAGADHPRRPRSRSAPEHQADRFAYQIEAVTSTEHLEQLGQTESSRAMCVTPCAFLDRTHRGLRRWLTQWWTLQLPQSPPLGGLHPLPPQASIAKTAAQWRSRRATLHRAAYAKGE